MSDIDAYYRHKADEIELLRSALIDAPTPVPATSFEKVIEQKFKLAARLRAQHAEQNWAATETHWNNADLNCQPYRMDYGYQRFNSTITGPQIYDAVSARSDSVTAWTSYTSCGMAAVSSVIMSLARAAIAANVHIQGGSYYETASFIQGYFPKFRLLSEHPLIGQGQPLSNAVNVLVLDSFSPSSKFGADGTEGIDPIDLVIFDTSCYPASSKRIDLAISRCESRGIPIVLVRSHIKLDMLGIEYGRLGSVVFCVPKTGLSDRALDLIRKMALGTHDAIRLSGGAASPSALPPFVGGSRHRQIERQRHARTLRNMRFFLQRLGETQLDHKCIQPFAHGQFCSFAPPEVSSRAEAQTAVEALAKRCVDHEIPARRAGSFGFDFVAIDEFSDVWNKREAVRLSLADLPLSTIDTLVDCVEKWASDFGLRS